MRGFRRAKSMRFGTTVAPGGDLHYERIAAAREHAKRHGAVIQDAAGLGSIALGPLNEKVAPEPIDPEAEQRVAALIYRLERPGCLRA